MDELKTIKSSLAEKVKKEPWFSGIGIGMVGPERGIIIMATNYDKAHEFLKDLSIECEWMIKEVGTIQAL